MLVYRFRMTSEEHEGFLREIDILPGQTFLDFHSIIIETADLLHCQRASFFITDKIFKKHQEITLKTEKRQVRKYNDDLDQIVSVPVTLPVMKSSKLKNYIEDPHQRMIYEFHGKEFILFHLELFKIVQSEGIYSYPRCHKQSGDLPKRPEIQSVALNEIPVKKNITQKIPLTIPEVLRPPDPIQEDEVEIAAIENELEEIQEEEAPIFDSQEIFLEHEMDQSAFNEEGEMKQIEDFEDLDNLERQFSGFDPSSDDF